MEGVDDELLFEKTYSTNSFDAFDKCLNVFCHDSGLDHFDSSCFAVAGPVENNCCEMTNLKWQVNGAQVQQSFNIPKVSVLNDFAAVGHGITGLDPSQLAKLNDIEPVQHGPIAIVGPGTGLGEAFLIWNDANEAYSIISTEGSHAPFAPKNEVQIELLKYMWAKNYKVCEVEQVCSGPGLRRIYEFLCKSIHTKPDDIEPAEIATRALANSCKTCRTTLKMFLEILGSECSSAALRVLATGGVYIAGGIPPKILPLLMDGSLTTAFENCNPSMRNVVASFPLIAVKTPNVGLLGAKVCCYGCRALATNTHQLKVLAKRQLGD